jgi:DNA-binding Lrp family transcriptional regulator
VWFMASAEGLTAKERRIIDALKREGGPISQGYLWDYAGVSWRGSLTVVRNLTKKGLVRYGEYWGPEDGHDIHLTDAGMNDGKR